MQVEKKSLFGVLNLYTGILFLILTLAFVLLGYVSDYQELKSDKEEILQNHQSNIEKNLKREVDHYLELLVLKRDSFMSQKKEMLKRRVDKAYQEIESLYNTYKGKKTKQEIEEIAITILRKVRFPHNGYYFITRTDGVEVLFDEHTELEGTDMLGLFNQDGVYVVKEMIDLVKSKSEGYYEYKWSKPNASNETNKISYIKLFEPFGWIIGTGLYEDDLTNNIQSEILDNTSQMKFDLTGDNYIFIATWDGKSLTYPARGKNMYDVQDANGKYVVRELIKKAKEGGGYVEYIMPSLNDEKSKKKISYVKGIPEWQWYVGAGVYVDDIYQEIATLQEKMQKEFIQIMGLTFFIAFILFWIFTYFYKKLIQKAQYDFDLFKDFFAKMATKGLPLEIEKIKFEEFENLALHANTMFDEKQKLEENLKKYEIIVAATGDFLALIDKDYKYVAINKTYQEYFDKSKEEIIGHSAEELFGKEDFEKNIKPYQDRALHGETVLQERWIDFPKGKRYIQVKYFPYLENAKERCDYIIISARDVTSAKESQNEILLWEQVFENTLEAVMICDKDMKILSVNNAFSEITGYSREEAIGEKSSIISLGGINNIEVGNVCAYVKQHGRWSGEIKSITKMGQVYPALFSASVLEDENGNIKNFIAVFSDISSMKESQEQLEFLAHHDTLTKLPNRVLLKDRITHAIENAKRNGSMLAVCFLDLDNFKKVNDSYGHSYGDAVLEESANRIKNSIREADTLSRIGGDEFILLLENLKDSTEVEMIAEKIKKILEEPFVINKKKFFLSTSLGVSCYPQNGESADVLIKNADIAMYKAKNAGKNTYRFYSTEMALQTKEDVDTENALKTAISENEFVVYYQPQVNLESGKIVGLEALIRWQHPSRGLLGPLQFIKLSEDTKMIIPIGEYVFERACEDLKVLQNESGFEGRISINVSGIQIEHSDFLGFLTKNLEKTGVNPNRLEIEITESVIMSDPQNWIEILKSIRALGVKIAIDDFGTGYSSLSYLRKLPIDKLKIDMAFVKDVPLEEDACAIVKSIINLAQSMKMTTLAEGIESREQEKYLYEHGCLEGQGYLYSKPISLKDVRELV